MSFDMNKVQFTSDELAIAAKLDGVVEKLSAAIADGLDVSDALAVLAAVPDIRDVVAFVVGTYPSRIHTAIRLQTLALALQRDNL